MKNLNLILSIVLVLICVACDGNTTPESTLQTNYVHVIKGQFSSFRRNLAGDALAQYGNKTAFASLQNALSGKNLTLTQPVLLNNGTDADGNLTFLYEAKGQLDNGSTIITVDVLCSTPGQAVTCIPGVPPATGICYENDGQGCRINKISL